LTDKTSVTGKIIESQNPESETTHNKMGRDI